MSRIKLCGSIERRRFLWAATKTAGVVAAVLLLLFAAACGGTAPSTADTNSGASTAAASSANSSANSSGETSAATETDTPPTPPIPIPDDNTYFNVYEVFVGSFYDSDGDGMGDLRGLIDKLDYIANPEIGLGADAIWMMPIMPSPSYHKYDVTDYMAIDPAYGTMADFDALIAACNERGVAVILDLVLNHTSVVHPWFLEARAEIAEQKSFDFFNYYQFALSKLSSVYYPVEGGYFYEAVFWEGMPDLNFDNGDLRDKMADIAAFWLNKGVAGFRLDAAMHVYTGEKDNLSFWTWFTDACRAVKPDVYLVAEVWDSDAKIVPYYQTGLTSLFNFGFAGASGAVANAINRENGRDLATRIANYDIVIKKQSPDAVNAVFLSNHDQDRSAGYFDNDESRMKLAAAVYLLIPGNPYIYYGEELAMTGRGKDENKRAPFIWSVADATGQTRGPAGMTEVPDLAEGAAEQLARPDSLLNRYRDILALKNKYPAMARGIPTVVKMEDKNICAYEIRYEYDENNENNGNNRNNGDTENNVNRGSQRFLIVHNLSADAKAVTIPNINMAAVEAVRYFTDRAEDAPFIEVDDTDKDMNMNNKDMNNHSTTETNMTNTTNTTNATTLHLPGYATAVFVF